jgi:hypothetical protein
MEVSKGPIIKVAGETSSKGVGELTVPKKITIKNNQVKKICGLTSKVARVSGVIPPGVVGVTPVSAGFLDIFPKFFRMPINPPPGVLGIGGKLGSALELPWPTNGDKSSGPGVVMPWVDPERARVER